MTDRPILFSAPMIKALLAGRKTQTRRIIKPQPRRFSPEHERKWFAHAIPSGSHEGKPTEWTWWEGPPHGPSLYHMGDVRYAPGDLLWVREAWADAGPHGLRYYATDDVHDLRRKRPSIHMPRWASRLTLEVTQVRVQRLQEISEADAIAEGCPGRLGRNPDFPDEWDPHPVEEFRDLWAEINGKRPGATWADDPWIVALTFKVHHSNVDDIQGARAA